MPMSTTAKHVHCMCAFLYVKKFVQDIHGAANVVRRRGSDVEAESKREARRDRLMAMRTEVRISETPATAVAGRAHAAMSHGVGNCLEQACLAMTFLKGMGVPCTLVSVSMPGNDQHLFVITAVLTTQVDLATCGVTAVCDPWAHENAANGSPHGFGAGVSTAVKHAAVLKGLGFGTIMTPRSTSPERGIGVNATPSSSSSSTSLSSSSSVAPTVSSPAIPNSSGT